MAVLNPPPTNLAMIAPDGRVSQVWADWLYRLSTQAAVAGSVSSISGGGVTTLLPGKDQFVYVDTTVANTTIILPKSNFSGQEIEINFVAGNHRIDVLPTAPDTIIGQSQVQMFVRTTSLRFKAANGQWVII